MSFIKRIISTILLGINILLFLALLISAYSAWLHPAAFPIASCLGLGFPILIILNMLFFLMWIIFKWKFACISLLGFLLTFSQHRDTIAIHMHQEIPQNSIKLLTYNTMSMGNQNKAPRKNPIIQYVNDSQADIVCLQECNFPHYLSKTINYDKVNSLLKGYPHKKRIQVGNEQSKNHVAVYSKYPITKSYKIGTDNSLYNGAALFLIKTGEQDTLAIINCHLESNKLTQSDKDVYKEILKTPDGHIVKQGARQLMKKLAEASSIRSRQIDSITKEIKKLRYPIIVCGDFNDTPISYAHSQLTEKLTDAFVESGRGLGISYNQNRFYFRIDHILHSPELRSFNCTVDRSIEASDHYPVWCYLQKP